METLVHYVGRATSVSADTAARIVRAGGSITYARKSRKLIVLLPRATRWRNGQASWPSGCGVVRLQLLGRCLHSVWAKR